MRIYFAMFFIGGGLFRASTANTVVDALFGLGFELVGLAIYIKDVRSMT